MSKHVTDQVIIESYQTTGSIWKTGKEVGLAGQTVHYRLKKLKIPRNHPPFSKNDQQVLRENYSFYRSSEKLDDLAKQLKRTKCFICRKAKALGLTSRVPIIRTADKLKKTGETIHNQYEKGRIHPRPMLGKSHTSKTKKLISTASFIMWADPDSKINSKKVSEARSKRMSILNTQRMQNGWNPYSTAKSGTREDLGIYVRSKMEANYLRYLTLLKIKWQYEPKIFYFKGIKKGTLTYTPDIYLPIKDEWIEIKGWFRDKDKVKLKRFKKHFPLEFSKLLFVVHDPWGEKKNSIALMTFLVDQLSVPDERIEDFKEIKNKLGGLIPFWE